MTRSLPQNRLFDGRPLSRVITGGRSGFHTSQIPLSELHGPYWTPQDMRIPTKTPSWKIYKKIQKESLFNFFQKTSVPFDKKAMDGSEMSGGKFTTKSEYIDECEKAFDSALEQLEEWLNEENRIRAVRSAIKVLDIISARKAAAVKQIQALRMEELRALKKDPSKADQFTYDAPTQPLDRRKTRKSPAAAIRPKIMAQSEIDDHDLVHAEADNALAMEKLYASAQQFTQTLIKNFITVAEYELVKFIYVNKLPSPHSTLEPTEEINGIIQTVLELFYGVSLQESTNIDSWKRTVNDQKKLAVLQPENYLDITPQRPEK